MHDWSRSHPMWRHAELLPRQSWIAEHAMEVVCSGLIVVLLVVVFGSRTFIPIGSGQRGVRWSLLHGTVSPVYTEGLHIVAPWDEVTIYDVRVQEISAPVHVLCAGSLDMTLNVSVRYRPLAEHLDELHARVGPDYARKLVLQQVASTLQRVFGNQDFETLTSSGRYTAALSAAVADARARLGPHLVVIEDVLVKQIILPPELANAIQGKFREQQVAELYRYRVEQAKSEAERKAIEADGIRRFQQIVSASLDDRFLQWRGIEATLDLAKSNNSKVVVFGRRSDGLPILLGGTQP